MPHQVGPPGRSVQPTDRVFTNATHWGAVGWRPATLRGTPPNQIGVYGDVVLTGRYTYLPGVQRRSLGIVPSCWMVASATGVPYWQHTKQPGSMAGGQRFGSQFHPTALTPWTAAQMQGRLVQAQIAQSGLAQVQFAQALIDANLRAA